MTIEEAKRIAREHNEHINNFNTISKWFKDMSDALNGTIEQ